MCRPGWLRVNCRLIFWDLPNLSLASRSRNRCHFRGWFTGLYIRASTAATPPYLQGWGITKLKSNIGARTVTIFLLPICLRTIFGTRLRFFLNINIRKTALSIWSTCCLHRLYLKCTAIVQNRLFWWFFKILYWKLISGSYFVIKFYFFRVYLNLFSI